MEGKGDKNHDRKKKQKGWEVNSTERRKGNRGKKKWITEKHEVLKLQNKYFLQQTSLPFR
jgi:hypothetical protein